MQRGSRKSTPRVKDGKVQRKNRSAETPNYHNTEPVYPTIDRQRPGEGYRHVLKKRDVERFIDILPDWAELSRGLKAIVLGPGSTESLGFHNTGVITLFAWPRGLTEDLGDTVVEEDGAVLDRLGVTREPIGNGLYRCQFTESTARGYQLLAVLLHELGHHHDRMTTKSQRDAARGEPYAIEYARLYAETIFEAYFREFGPK